MLDGCLVKMYMHLSNDTKTQIQTKIETHRTIIYTRMWIQISNVATEQSRRQIFDCAQRHIGRANRRTHGAAQHPCEGRYHSSSSAAQYSIKSNLPGRVDKPTARHREWLYREWVVRPAWWHNTESDAMGRRDRLSLAVSVPTKRTRKYCPFIETPANSTRVHLKPQKTRVVYVKFNKSSSPPQTDGLLWTCQASDGLNSSSALL